LYLARVVHRVDRFHLAIVTQARRVEEHHRGRLQCRRGCSGCCVDGITVFAVEADAIRRHHAELLRHGAPHPEGACAFLDESGACRIYEHRPYVCRTQGLPLRWIDEDEAVERRDICELNDHPDGAWPKLTSLDEEACWTIGPAEAELQQLQREFEPAELSRVKLRDLFHGR
jgi:hypothetical protein